jgi:hypothetical protein
MVVYISTILGFVGTAVKKAGKQQISLSSQGFYTGN